MTVGIDTVACTLERPCLSASGVTVRAVIVPVLLVDCPLTKVNGRVGSAGVRLVSVTLVVSRVDCVMLASKTFLTVTHTFSHSPLIGFPLIFPGHLSAPLLLQKDIFLPPFYLSLHNMQMAFFLCSGRG